MNIKEIDILVNKYRDEVLIAFSGKLVEPTKLDKITQRKAAISFKKGKKNAKIKTKRKEIVSVTDRSNCTCNKKKSGNLSECE